MKQSEFLNIREFGNLEKNTYDVVINNPHGDDGRTFLQKFPEFLSIIQFDQSLFHHYLDIEKDAGAPELSEAIAHALIQKEPSLKVLVIDFLMPRGIVDPNRITEKSIRDLFDKDSQTIWVDRFKEIHKDAIDTVFAYLDQLSSDGVLLDVHTMAPYNVKNLDDSPLEAVKESPEDISDYIDAYTNPERRGKRRKVDIVTKLMDDNSIISHKGLIQSFEKQFNRHDIPYAFDDPYPYAKHIMIYNYLVKHPGIQIDIPKDYLATINAENSEYDLAHSPLDLEKVEHYANAIADALLEGKG